MDDLQIGHFHSALQSLTGVSILRQPKFKNGSSVTEWVFKGARMKQLKRKPPSRSRH